MGGFIARQPNGLLCRFSDTVGCVSHYNLTDEEFIELCAERAREDARDVIKNHLQPFECVLSETEVGENIEEDEWRQILKEMNEKRED